MKMQDPDTKIPDTGAPIYLSSFRKEARRTHNRCVIQQYYTATVLVAVLGVATAAAFLTFHPANAGGVNPAATRTAQQASVRS